MRLKCFSSLRGAVDERLHLGLCAGAREARAVGHGGAPDGGEGEAVEGLHEEHQPGPGPNVI